MSIFTFGTVHFVYFDAYAFVLLLPTVYCEHCQVEESAVHVIMECIVINGAVVPFLYKMALVHQSTAFPTFLLLKVP